MQFPRFPSRQRGLAIYAIVVAFAVVGGGFLFSFVDSKALERRRAAHNNIVFGQVKAGLVAYTQAGDALMLRNICTVTPCAPPNWRPGELPCPDINSPTDYTNRGWASATCTAGQLGRVPWRTLGIDEPLDDTGETLWYAISAAFRPFASTSTPITSNSVGTLTVYDASGMSDTTTTTTTTQTTRAVAVVIAPSVALSGQSRGSGTATCSTTGTTIAANLCAANYLERVNGRNNSTNGGPYVSAPSSSTINDRVLFLSNDQLLPFAEQRVARQMIALLTQYKTYTASVGGGATYPGGIYPWADLADGNSNGTGGAAYNKNRFPCGTALPVTWATAGITLPSWLTNGCAALTGWNTVVHYAVARNQLQASGSICTTCSLATLRLNGVTGTNLIIMTPGALVSGTRTWPGSFTASTGYFDDAENADNNDDDYVAPTSTAFNRDRLYKLP